jgi:hypothetical protein
MIRAGDRFPALDGVRIDSDFLCEGAQRLPAPELFEAIPKFVGFGQRLFDAWSLSGDRLELQNLS